MLVSAVILAAGESKRFNGIKALAQVNGETVLDRAISKFNTLEVADVYVCLGSYVDKLLPLLPLNVKPIISKHWQKGMGHSIADAVSALDNKCSHLMIYLVDQLEISESHLSNLINKSIAAPDEIIVTMAHGIMMPPVIFPRRYYDDLLKLTGDNGAKQILKRFASPDFAVHFNAASNDIDTQEKLNEFLNKQLQGIWSKYDQIENQ